MNVETNIIEKYLINLRYKKITSYDAVYDKYLDAINRHENINTSLFYLAVLAAFKGELSDSISLLRKTLENDKDFCEANFNLALLYYVIGDVDLFHKHLDHAIKTGAPRKLISEIEQLMMRKEVTVDKVHKESRERILINFIGPLLIALTIGYLYKGFLTEGYLIGWDSMAHVFKSWYVKESLLGKYDLDWCTLWYQGSPIIPTYAPLFYYLSAIFSIISQIDIQMVSKLVTFISFPMSALSFYFSFRKKENWSTVLCGGLLYGLIPWNLNYVRFLGNPPITLSFVFIPLLFKYFNEKNDKSIIISSILYSAIFLSHQATGILIAYILFCHTLLNYPLYKTIRLPLINLIKVGLYSVGLLGFFWLPYIFYTMKIETAQPIFASADESLANLFNSNHYMYVGELLFIIWITSISINLIRREHEGIRYSLLSLLTIITSVGYRDPLIGIFYPVQSLIGPGLRMNVASSFFIVISIIYAVNSISSYYVERKKSIHVAFIICTLILVASFFPLYKFWNTKIPSSHLEIYSTIKEDDEDFRVWWVPRGALPAALPMFVEKPTPDGWYDQGANEEVYLMIHRLNDELLITNPDLFVSELSMMSVKYLIVMGRTNIDNLGRNEQLELIQTYGDVSLFRNKYYDNITTIDKPSQTLLIRTMGIILTLLTLLYFYMRDVYVIKNTISKLSKKVPVF